MGEEGFEVELSDCELKRGRSILSSGHLLRVVRHALHLGLIPWDDTIIQFLKLRYVHHGALSAVAQLPAFGTGDCRKINWV